MPNTPKKQRYNQMKPYQIIQMTARLKKKMRIHGGKPCSKPNSKMILTKPR
jgi:hypothetical protein